MAKAKEMTVPVTALDPIRYDGDDYQPGDTLDVRKTDLQQLLDQHSAELVAQPTT